MVRWWTGWARAPSRASGACPAVRRRAAAAATGMRTSTCWWSAPGRPGSAAAVEAAAAGDRVMLVDERPRSAARCSLRAADRTGGPVGGGSRPRSDDLLAGRDARPGPSTAAPGIYDDGFVGRTSGSRPFERLWHVRARQRRAGHRGARAADRVRRQRPARASCWRARSATTSTGSPCVPGDTGGRLHHERTAASTAAAARRNAGVPSSTVVDPLGARPTVRGAAPRGSTRPRTAGPWWGPTGRERLDGGPARTTAPRRGRSPPICSPCLGGWNPATAACTERSAERMRLGRAGEARFVARRRGP